MNNKIALVTNVLDYAGPPAVEALLEGGHQWLAKDCIPSLFKPGGEIKISTICLHVLAQQRVKASRKYSSDTNEP